MRKLTLAISAAALALGGAGVAVAQYGGPGSAGPERGLRAADTNADGEISLEEARAHGAERFERMDANGDGQLSRDDRDAHREQRFAEADANGDGEITPEEMTAAREAREARMAERRAARQERMFAQLDTDGSGGLSQAEMIAGREARRGAGERRRGGRRGGDRAMRMLRAADTNQDSVVTRAEFDTAIETRFARVDADGSGTVTAEEMQAMRDARRTERRQRRGAPDPTT